MRYGVVGLGNMGLAIAKAAVSGGLDTLVWNRSPARSALAGGGATAAPTLAELVRQADVILLVLPDYETTREVLLSEDVAGALDGKAIVQLCSGTPEEAREFATAIASLGARCLDGKIFTYPARVGAADTRFAYAGDEALYDRISEQLAIFGARSAWLGEDPGLAAAADLAWLSYLYGSMAGLFQGLAYARSEGLPDDAVFGSVPSWLVEIEAEARYSRSLIARGDFHGTQATLDVHLAAMRHLLDTAESRRISTRFPRMIVDVFGEAVAEGHGDEEICGAIKAFESRPTGTSPGS